eukprot:CAMPEP_0206437668 /NCGR_PEP_ID=MMETSP0324_2-20121206/11174_1 /ASSEMBLY_ACC=CAM_ASM_000836 /TAXON_ID=2866 /ORGANISM="Crypthecodinium cohnii, Strain Seligo" /LENGTH=831 /DNA_ID=CAMNT_0053904985 /DNA_START=1 /DNA_END=2496 /DNA_ORIENTATION=-
MGVDITSEGLRQLERAQRLLEAPGPSTNATNRPVHKALEQLFSEARTRAPPSGIAPGPILGGAGRTKLLQETQLLERAVNDFCITGRAGGIATTGATTGQAVSSSKVPATFADPIELQDSSNVDLESFFALRRERMLLGVVEEAHRDAMRELERRSIKKVQTEWEASKAKILAGLNPHRTVQSLASGAAAEVRGKVQFLSSNQAVEAPAQDAAIVATLQQKITPASVLKVGSLSCETCPSNRGELMECWAIVSHILAKTKREALCGSLCYLQSRFAEELRTVVYRSADARIGGVPDAWSLVAAFGRIKFETAAFPSTPAHAWYAAYLAARAGFTHLLVQLPTLASSVSAQCPMLRTVCIQMARRLQATATQQRASEDFVGASDQCDRSELVRADLSEDSGPFHDILVSTLIGRPFTFSRLPEGTIEDWLWYRLHTVHVASGDSEEAPEFKEHLADLQKRVLELPASHYDPPAVSVSVVPTGSHGAGGVATQTLNFVKVSMLTLQVKTAILHLRHQDASHKGAAVHMALLLRAAGAACLQPSDDPQNEVAFDIPGLVCDYASQFKCGHQLKYFRLLEPKDRVEALTRLLLNGGAGTNEELLGVIDSNGRHRPGLLQEALQASATATDADHAEFAELCAKAGRTALEGGQYREAIRLLHLGRCYSEVLQALCRCLRLPIWRDPAFASSADAAQLGQDVRRFFAIYERNLDRYGIPLGPWKVARKLYAIRMFLTFCSQGQPEAALDIFDSEQLLPLDGDSTAAATAGEADDDIAVEFPRIVANYVRILQHFSQGGSGTGLPLRVRRLQGMLAMQAHRFALDKETTAILASLTLR